VRQEIRSKGAREASKRDDKEAVHKLADRQEAADKEAASACR
jgi:hypothetical protein